MRKTSYLFIASLALLLINPSAFGAWVWSPEAGKFINPDAEVQDTPQEQYDYAMEYYKNRNFKEALQQFRLLLRKYAGAQVAPEAQFRLGTIYEELGDYTKAFRAYRDLQLRYPQSERVSEAIAREFRIGNLFLSGRKAKLMGLAILPSGPKAIEIFKHIVEAAPYSEYGDKAQFRLGLAYKKTNQFEESIQAFQGLIDQYPRSDLIPQARFQIADTSYLQSVVATRDQRVVDRASKELDSFLAHYPDSNVSDKAAKLRQEIDEKNAEKNYRIGLFYEKENFLDSAFIYYRDTAERYPHTEWGKKAAERLQALERPVDFLKSQEAEVLLKKEALEKELAKVGGTDPSRKKDLDWELKRIEQEQKEIQKSKPETLKRRQAALRQKEKMLKEKRKALQKKKKHFANNPSDDLAVAFERWEASLIDEEQALAREKVQIGEWGSNLGVNTEPFYTQWVPSLGKEAPSPVEQVREMEEGHLRKLSKEKREWVQKKDGLYRKYEKLLQEEGLAGKPEPSLEEARKVLEGQSSQIQQLEKKLEEKEALYQKHFGSPAWQSVLRVPGQAIEKSVNILNPFEGPSRKDWHSKSAGELKVLENQWHEKVASQKALVDMITTAFDDELARAEENRLTDEAKEQIDPKALRKNIKNLERQIRSHYNEIQDRNERKNELLEEVDRLLHGREKEKGGAGRALSAPARGVYLFGKSFLFGLPNRDVELTEEARRTTGGEADQSLLRELHEQIELESLLIETRNQEILRLKREVEGLRAQVSLAGAPPVRPLLVKIPYVFVREAIVSANRLVPQKDRREKIIGQLNRETGKLEQLKREEAKLQDLIKEKRGAKAPPREAQPAAPPAAPTPVETVPDREALRDEIRNLRKQLELQADHYVDQHKTFEKARWQKLSFGRNKSHTKKLMRIEENLVKLIEKEQRLHEEEASLLEKKKTAVEQFLAAPPSNLFARELKGEREQIDSQLSEVHKGQVTLGEELRRLRPQASPPS